MNVEPHHARALEPSHRPHAAAPATARAADGVAAADRGDRASGSKSYAAAEKDRRVGVADGFRWIPDVQRSFEAYLENLLHVSAVLRGFNAELRDVLQRFDD